MINKIITAVIILAAGFTKASAQDLHFSQYFNAPLLVNPANTGFMPDYDYRIGANYRTQWASVSNPYKTFSAWGDGQLFNDRFENGWVGVGASLLTDKAGSGNLKSTKAYGSVAYHQLLGLNSLVSVGFTGGYVSKSIDFTKLSFDNQWNGQFFDVSVPNNEPFAFSRVSYFDLQAGVNYAFFPSDNAWINAGVSLQHINRPSESFFKDEFNDTRVASRFTGFLNGSFKLNDQWILHPNVYVSRMAKATEVVGGLTANYNLSGDGATQLIGGAYYRAGDAAIPMVGFQINDLKLTFNYDATVSNLRNANGTRGAYEISIVKSGLFNPDKAVKCPTVKF